MGHRSLAGLITVQCLAQYSSEERIMLPRVWVTLDPSQFDEDFGLGKAKLPQFCDSAVLTVRSDRGLVIAALVLTMTATLWTDSHVVWTLFGNLLKSISLPTQGKVNSVIKRDSCIRFLSSAAF